METKVLITVKTYPAISTKYDELVCTAGMKENGDWIRIYPINFRQLPYDQQYKKFYWIEADLIRNTKDLRPETYRPQSNIKILNRIDTENEWQKRKEIILKKVYTDMEKLIALSKKKPNPLSLAVFKPTEIIDLAIESTEEEWSIEKQNKLKQLKLFSTKNKPIKKLPYNFYYIFKDNIGKQRKLLIEDWEIGALYWRMLYRRKGDRKQALQEVRSTYLDKFVREKDIYFFLGTTLANHYISRNPFIIIGVFYPPKRN